MTVSYQVTAEGGPGGIVSARDFVYCFKTGYKDNGAIFVQGGMSVDSDLAPKSPKGLVRAWNGPGAQIIRPLSDESGCEFIWLMDCDYRGWIPSHILDLAMPVAQLQFVECVRKLADGIKAGKL